MDFEITPEPTELERRAIAAALTEDDAERELESAWADASFPRADEP